MVRIRLHFHTVGSQCTTIPQADQFVEKWICQCIPCHSWIYADNVVLRPISVLVSRYVSENYSTGSIMQTCIDKHLHCMQHLILRTVLVIR